MLGRSCRVLLDALWRAAREAIRAATQPAESRSSPHPVPSCAAGPPAGGEAHGPAWKSPTLVIVTAVNVLILTVSVVNFSVVFSHSDRNLAQAPENRREAGSQKVAKLKESRKPSAPEQTVQLKVEQTDPEKEVFIKFVQQNANDPSGLEIVFWAERENNLRQVRFRCNQVGHTRRGNPVMLEDAVITYDGENIKSVCLVRTYQVWYTH
jgi:hypothetical protein